MQVTFASQAIGATGGIVATVELSTYSFCSQTIRTDYKYPREPVDKCVDELLANTGKSVLNQPLTNDLYNLWITDNVN